MKKIFVLLYSCMIGVSSFASGAVNINEKLLRSFKERFPNAEQVSWKESTETYEVNFVEDGVRSNIVYGKDGAFQSSRRFYQERTLPYYLLINIKKKYAGKKIFGVTEISRVSGIEYYIKLEDARVWTTIRIDEEGDLTVVEKYRKAS